MRPQPAMGAHHEACNRPQLLIADEVQAGSAHRRRLSAQWVATDLMRSEVARRRRPDRGDAFTKGCSGGRRFASRQHIWRKLLRARRWCPRRDGEGVLMYHVAGSGSGRSGAARAGGPSTCIGRCGAPARSGDDPIAPTAPSAPSFPAWTAREPNGRDGLRPCRRYVITAERSRITRLLTRVVADRGNNSMTNGIQRSDRLQRPDGARMMPTNSRGHLPDPRRSLVQASGRRGGARRRVRRRGARAPGRRSPRCVAVVARKPAAANRNAAVAELAAGAATRGFATPSPSRTAVHFSRWASHVPAHGVPERSAPTHGVPFVRRVRKIRVRCR